MATTRTDVRAWRDERTLQWAYHEKGMTQREVGALLGCSKACVSKWLPRHDIEGKKPGPGGELKNDCPWRNKRILKKLHHEEDLPQEKIADRLGCSTGTVREWMGRHDIEVHRSDIPRELLNREWLVEKHHDNDLRLYEIANKLDCSTSCVSSWMDRHDIETKRPTGEDHHRYNSVSVECSWCGGTIERQKSQAESHDHHFCSTDCEGLWKSENVVGDDHHQYKKAATNCEYCGSEIEIHRYRYKEQSHHFCPGGDCYGKWRSENIVGENHPQFDGGEFPYGAGWTDWKKRKVRIRDQARCQHCGRTEPEHIEKFGKKHHVHHITPARQMDDPVQRNAMQNLITLCAGECHHFWEMTAPLRPITETTSAD